MLTVNSANYSTDTVSHLHILNIHENARTERKPLLEQTGDGEQIVVRLGWDVHDILITTTMQYALARSPSAPKDHAKD